MNLQKEFEAKKHCGSIHEAYPDKKQAAIMFKKFKMAGIVQKSWKRSTGLLKTSRTSYHRQWRANNRDKVLKHNITWLLKKAKEIEQSQRIL